MQGKLIPAIGLTAINCLALQRLQNKFGMGYPEIEEFSPDCRTFTDDGVRRLYITPGVFDGDSSFDGTFYLENSSPTNLPVGNSPRSMFGWVKPSMSASYELGLFGYGPPDSTSGYDHCNLYYGTDDGLTFRGGDAFDPSDLANNLSSTVDNFVGMTWDGTTLTIYVNASSWTTTPGSIDTSAGYIRVALGDYWANSITGLFQGEIIDVGIWSVSLSDDNVSLLYAAGPCQYNSLPGSTYGLATSGGDEILCSNGDLLDAFISVGNGLVSFWNLSESSGTRYDSVRYPSGNNLNEAYL